MKLLYINAINLKFIEAKKPLSKQWQYIITIGILLLVMVYSYKSQINFWLGKSCNLTDYFFIIITAYLILNVIVVAFISNEEIVSKVEEKKVKEVVIEVEKKKGDDFIFHKPIFYDYKKERLENELNNDVPLDSLSQPEPELEEFDFEKSITTLPQDIDFNTEEFAIKDEIIDEEIDVNSQDISKESEDNTKAEGGEILPNDVKNDDDLRNAIENIL